MPFAAPIQKQRSSSYQKIHQKRLQNHSQQFKNSEITHISTECSNQQTINNETLQQNDSILLKNRSFSQQPSYNSAFDQKDSILQVKSEDQTTNIIILQNKQQNLNDQTQKLIEKGIYEIIEKNIMNSTEQSNINTNFNSNKDEQQCRTNNDAPNQHNLQESAQNSENKSSFYTNCFNSIDKQYPNQHNLSTQEMIRIDKILKDHNASKENKNFTNNNINHQQGKNKKVKVYTFDLNKIETMVRDLKNLESKSLFQQQAQYDLNTYTKLYTYILDRK